MDSLARFKTAQDSAHAGFEVALHELRAGQKRSHWIWYVFPQIAGLGTSTMSSRFGIQGRGEAEAYLRDDTLRARLSEAIDAVAFHLVAAPPRRLAALMGSEIDARKLVSSMTLFEAVAADRAQRDQNTEMARLAEQARMVLDSASREGYDRCRFTLQQLARDAAADG